MLRKTGSYGALCEGFRWKIPQRYNIGTDICDRWAEVDPERLAILDVAADGTAQEHSFADLAEASNRLANALAGLGLGRTGEVGDRVGVLLPQGFETAVTHIAAWKMGCVSLPLFTLFGPEALLHRLRDSGARAVVTNAAGAALLGGLRDQLPALQVVLSIDGRSGGALDYALQIAAASAAFTPARTFADDPALLIYTSGTTGQPKGALHAHRVLLGHLPGVEISHDFLPQPGDRFWTPADWAWIGGLLDVLCPALHHGIAVVAHRFEKFTAQAAFALMRDHKVRNAFLPPTALKLMRQAPEAAAAAAGLELRSVASGGEPLGAELIAWGQRVLGTTINEFYGQTECNMIVSCCAALDAPQPGAMGRAVPGHRLAIVDPATGAAVAAGEEGEIAALAGDPVMFLRYWNNERATQDKFVGDWLLTGDRGVMDAAGWIRFVGRGDDVINSAGYRIGPAEIEDCLIQHPDVVLAGVVGQPDPLRGEIVVAFVTLRAAAAPCDALADEIAGFVKTRLAAHEYPRAVHFLGAMPMTTTGKIIRRALREIAAEKTRPGAPP